KLVAGSVLIIMTVSVARMTWAQESPPITSIGGAISSANPGALATGATNTVPDGVDPQTAALLAALEQLPTIPADAVPSDIAAMYYSAANFFWWPPFPANALGLPVWDMG